jgi:GT2 family glycosyltransferase
MTLSAAIAIATLNRHTQLAQTLRYLSQVDLSAIIEILVVDQTGIPFDIAPWQPEFPVPLRLIHLGQRGLCLARNQALYKSQADVILYIDDDVIPAPDLVNQHLRFYAEHPKAVAIAGFEDLSQSAIKNHFRSALKQLVIELSRPYLKRHKTYCSFLDYSGYPVGLITQTGLFLCDFSRPYPCRVMTPRGCNMSFLRSALLKINGFDEGFTGVARREESDASLRLLQAIPGAEIWFNPEAKLVHLTAAQGGCRIPSSYAWGQSLIQSETRFAYRHLANSDYTIFCLRLILLQFWQFMQHPKLLKILLDPPCPLWLESSLAAEQEKVLK